MADALSYVKAFERNCPDVRMSKDERAELLRLFFVCICDQDATATGRAYQMAKKITHEAGYSWTDPRTLITYPPPGKSS